MAPRPTATCMVANVALNAIDFIAGGSMIFYGVDAYNTKTFEGVLLPIHVGSFGLLIMLGVFYIPNRIGVWVPFYLTFPGRGIVYLFWGGFILDPFGYSFYGLIIGVGLLLISGLYFLLAILVTFDVIQCSLPSPLCQNDFKQTFEFTQAKQKTKSDRDKYVSLNDEDGYDEELDLH